MSQLGLFSDGGRAQQPRAASRPAPPATSAARPEPPPSLDGGLWYDDAGPTVARLWLSLPNPHFGPWISAGLRVDVERQVGRRPVTWLATVGLDLPDACRTRWWTCVAFATQDEAAEEAAAMALAALAMLEASMRGEPVETPGDRELRAAEEHADALPEVCAAVAEMLAAKEIRAAIGMFGDGHPEAHHRYLVARARAEDVRQRAIDAFMAAHGWREFV